MNPPCAVAKLHPHLNAGKNTSIVTVMPRTPCSSVQFDSGDRWELGLRWALSVNAAAVACLVTWSAPPSKGYEGEDDTRQCGPSDREWVVTIKSRYLFT